MNDLENVGPASKVFEAEFRRQILASERERASLQALIAVALLLVVTVVDAVYIVTGNPLPAFKAALLVVTAGEEQGAGEEQKNRVKSQHLTFRLALQTTRRTHRNFLTSSTTGIRVIRNQQLPL